MNKQIEAGMFIAVAVLMVMSAASAFHLTESGDTGNVDNYIRTQWHHVTHWLTTRTTAQQSVPMEKSTHPLQDAIPEQNEVSSAAPKGTPVQSPSTDQTDTFKRFSQIGVEFVDSMSQQDWKTLTSALANDSPSTNKVVQEMIAKHVSLADLNWIESAFQGNQRFDASDIVLLQETLREAKAQLTPEEMSLLHQAYPVIPETKP